MLVSYYWSDDADRTRRQLLEHRPQDAHETDEQVREPADANLVQLLDRADGELVVSLNVDALGVVDLGKYQPSSSSGSTRAYD